MSSLEALKNRIATLRCNNRIGSRDIANQEILEIAMFLENYIVKDLERKEQLEKENQELKESFKISSNDQIYYRYNELKTEYQKLKKAIEILKKVVFLNPYEFLQTECQCYGLSKKEYELLKEVFSNDK